MDFESLWRGAGAAERKPSLSATWANPRETQSVKGFVRPENRDSPPNWSRFCRLFCFFLTPLLSALLPVETTREIPCWSEQNSCGIFRLSLQARFISFRPLRSHTSNGWTEMPRSASRTIASSSTTSRRAQRRQGRIQFDRRRESRNARDAYCGTASSPPPRSPPV